MTKTSTQTDRLVRDEVVPGAEWVLAGEGQATRKYDGTCCLVRDGRLFKRYDLKPGKTPPPDFEPAQEEDTPTGKRPGWIPVSDTNPNDCWHREAVAEGLPPSGTYELCGPKVQGNPEGFAEHTLVKHGAKILPAAPRTFAGLHAYFRLVGVEGIVWHHPDGRMVKIKAKDFGLKRVRLE